MYVIFVGETKFDYDNSYSKFPESRMKINSLLKFAFCKLKKKKGKVFRDASVLILDVTYIHVGACNCAYSCMWVE